MVMKGEVNPYNPMTVLFSSDGEYVITRNAQGQSQVRVWDCMTGHEIFGEKRRNKIADRGDSENLAELRRSLRKGPWTEYEITGINSAGTLVLSRSSTGGNARLWEVETGKLIAVFGGISDHVTVAAMNRHGTRIATSGYDGKIRLWATNGHLFAVLSHGERIRYLSFAPDDSRIISASTDGTLRLWDSNLGAEVTNPTSNSFVRHGEVLDGVRRINPKYAGVTRLDSGEAIQICTPYR